MSSLLSWQHWRQMDCCGNLLYLYSVMSCNVKQDKPNLSISTFLDYLLSSVQLEWCFRAVIVGSAWTWNCDNLPLIRDWDASSCRVASSVPGQCTWHSEVTLFKFRTVYRSESHQVTQLFPCQSAGESKDDEAAADFLWLESNALSSLQCFDGVDWVTWGTFSL